jgi:DNA-binding PadR family transcriptional regulator
MAKISSMKAAKCCAIDYTDKTYWNGLIKMSLSKFFILSVLRERSMHGYEIAQEVERLTKGCCSPTEGTIYPVLKEFMQGKYVTSRVSKVSGRVRKVYTLTKKGHKAFAIATKAWLEVSAYISKN